MAGRTQRDRKAETRQRLLHAAAELLARHGVDAISVDAVAEAAGRTSGSIYAHFGSKQGLLTALLDGWRGQAAAAIGAETHVSDDTAGKLGALWKNFADPPDEHGTWWLLLEHELWLRAARDPAIGTPLARRYAAGRAAMAASFDRWAGDGEGAAGDRSRGDRLAVLTLAMLLGLEMQRRLDPDIVTDELAQAGLNRLFELRQAGTQAGTYDGPPDGPPSGLGRPTQPANRAEPGDDAP